MRRNWRCAVLLTTFAVMSPTATQAQHVGGLVVGLAAEGMRTRADALATVSGPGVHALLGYGVSSHVMLLIEAGAGFAESRVLAHACVCGRVYGPVIARIAPYAEIGFAAHGRELEAERFASGVGLSLGAGAEYFFLPHRSVVISVNRWSGHYDELEQGVGSTPVDIDASTVRFTVGAHLRPLRHRD